MRYKNLLPAVAAALLLGLPLSGRAAQFYAEHIIVSPSAPTDQDDIQLTVYGYLANTGSFIVNTDATVTGLGVALTINADNTGGITIPMTIPDTLTFDLGMLPGGTYTITINGNQVNDEAPLEQHNFTVTGGGSPPPCDSLIIAGVTWAPFSDTALMVHVFNPTSELFDYPGFILLDANGDTLAKEAIDLFGLPTESSILLPIHAGATIPEGPFTGTLELWTDFYDEFACSWDMTFDLCPPAPCAPLNVFIQNTGAELSAGGFQYTISHEGAPVANGTFALSAENQYDSDSLCLPPGNYLMAVVADGAPGGTPFFGVNEGPAVQGPTATLVITTFSAVGFNFYGPCSGAPLGIAQNPSAKLVLASGYGTTVVKRSDGRALGALRVFDAQGRLVSGGNEPGARHAWTTTGWAPGLYLLRAIGPDHRELTARWAVE